MRAVLLDLDGTLVDSRPGIEASLDAALRSLGHIPDPALDKTFALGPPLPEGMRALLAQYGDTRVEAAVEAYRAAYAASGLFDGAVFAGIPAALEALRAGGARLFVATSKRTDLARRLLEHVGLASRFETIYGTVPGGALDDKAALIAQILAAECLDPAATIMVGDRRHDIQGARANAIPALGVRWGYGTRLELEAAGADALVAAPAELARVALSTPYRGCLPG